MTICFYSTQKAYGRFSNFSDYGFSLDQLWWFSSGHYVQAHKFTHKFISTPAHFEAIRQAKSPKEAALMGRERQQPLHADWEQVKDRMMYRAVFQEFKTHANIAELLMSTGDKILIENTSTDYRWGCSTDKTGKIGLGKF
jgi:N-glycosidase YbiA